MARTAPDTDRPRHGLARLLPSPAMLVALAALLVALGGTGYAAVTIGSEQIRDNSIEDVNVKNDTLLSRDIGDGAILRRDLDPTALNIKDDTVLSRDIRDGTILQKDISAGALAGLEGPKGDTGPATGPPGPPGTARAFAHVNGTVVGKLFMVEDASSQGIDDENVTSPRVGVYCFADLGFIPKIAIATFASTSAGAVSDDVVLRAHVGSGSGVHGRARRRLGHAGATRHRQPGRRALLRAVRVAETPDPGVHETGDFAIACARHDSIGAPAPSATSRPPAGTARTGTAPIRGPGISRGTQASASRRHRR